MLTIRPCAPGRTVAQFVGTAARGRPGWRGERVAAWLLAGVITLLLVFGPIGAPPIAGAQPTVSAWHLADMRWKDGDGRGVQAGNLLLDQVVVNEQGGQMRLTSKIDGCKSGPPAVWLFRWNFGSRDIRTVVKGDSFAVNLSVETGSTVACGVDEGSIPFAAVNAEGARSWIMDEAHLTAGPNELITAPGGNDRFYLDPTRPGHVPDPRLIKVDTRWNNQRGYFTVHVLQRWGFVFEALYLYEAGPGAPATAAALSPSQWDFTNCADAGTTGSGAEQVNANLWNLPGGCHVRFRTGGQSWLTTSFTATAAPTGACTLTVLHLSSALSDSQAGYSPVRISLNGQPVYEDSPGPGTTGPAGIWEQLQLDVSGLIQAGTNTLRWDFLDGATTHYWLKSFAVSCG